MIQTLKEASVYETNQHSMRVPLSYAIQVMPKDLIHLLDLFPEYHLSHNPLGLGDAHLPQGSSIMGHAASQPFAFRDASLLPDDQHKTCD